MNRTQRICTVNAVAQWQSPLGILTLAEDGLGLCAATLREENCGGETRMTPLLEQAIAELADYFEGRRTLFNVPLSLHGTPFQLQVWRALCAIPYGETRSYAGIAAAVGNPRATRAVGMANHRNPLMILVPCHRVVGKHGDLVGYAGGLDVKRALLNLEHVHA